MPVERALTSRQTLWTGLLVSLCLHAGMLWWLRWDNTVPPVASMLDIVLVNAASHAIPAAVPAQPRLLAQVASVGGGNEGPQDAAAMLPYTGPDSVPWVQEALRQRQLQLEAAQHEMLSRLVGESAVPLPHDPSLSWQHRAAVGRDDADQDAVLENARIAALAERVRAYDRQPRTHFFAPSTSPSRYAQYVDAWRRVIEDVGTRHYPQQARGRVYGRLRMTVLLASDGTVQAIDIDQPSEQPLLNQAARRIVQLAAPFAPFPPEIAREAGQLSITRTWHFVNDRLSTEGFAP